MSKNRASSLLSTQFVTALISTSLVLVLLGTIVLFVLTARNLSDYVRENLNVTVLLSDDITQGEIESLQRSLEEQPAKHSQNLQSMRAQLSLTIHPRFEWIKMCR